MSYYEIGSTHAAHMSRHIGKIMQRVRKGDVNQEEISRRLEAVMKEIKSLSEKYDDARFYLNRNHSNMGLEVPELNIVLPVLKDKDTAKQFRYMENLIPSDYMSVSKLQMHFEYNTQAPQDEHLHTCMGVIEASISQLAWAAAELKLYIK